MFKHVSGLFLFLGWVMACSTHASAEDMPFYPSVFERAIHAKFGGRVKGYAFVVTDKKGLIAKAQGGWAQDRSDGNVKMTIDTPTNIGSVVKMYSMAALLRLFQNKKLASKSINWQLDQPMYHQLPKKWRTKYFPQGNPQRLITYRHLLSHTSGYKMSDGETQTAVDQRKAAAFEAAPYGSKQSYLFYKGIKKGDLGKHQYNNFNARTLQFLIPRLAYPVLSDRVEKRHRFFPISVYSEQIDSALGALYEKYMHSTAKLLSNSFSASCRPKNRWPGRYAKGYRDQFAKSGEVFDVSYCRPQGGWYMSVRSLAEFTRALTFSNTFFKQNKFSVMGDPLIVFNGWSSTKKFKYETGREYWRRHGGTHSNYRATVVELPNGHFGIGAINSPTYSSRELDEMIQDAYYQATRKRFARTGVTEEQFQNYFDDIAKHGGSFEWIDFYDAGGKVYVNFIVGPSKVKYRVRYRLTASELLSEVRKYVKHGNFKIKQIESYRDKGNTRFAYIFTVGKGPDPRIYMAKSEEFHLDAFKDLTSKGYHPVNISVVSVGGERKYTAFYQEGSVNGWALKSKVRAEDVDAVIAEWAKKGRGVSYTNAYFHDNRFYQSMVFNGKTDPETRQFIASNETMGSTYQKQKEEKKQNVLMITAAYGVREKKFASVWTKNRVIDPTKPFNVNIKLTPKGTGCPMTIEARAFIDYPFSNKRPEAKFRFSHNGKLSKLLEIRAREVKFGSAKFYRVERIKTYKDLQPGNHKFRVEVRGGQKSKFKTITVKCPPYKATQAWLTLDIEKKDICKKKVDAKITVLSNGPGSNTYRIQNKNGQDIKVGSVKTKWDGHKYVGSKKTSFKLGAYNGVIKLVILNHDSAYDQELVNIKCLQPVKGKLTLKSVRPNSCKAEALVAIHTNIPGKLPYELECGVGRSWKKTVKAPTSNKIGVDKVKFTAKDGEQVTCILRTRLQGKITPLSGTSKTFSCKKFPQIVCTRGQVRGQRCICPGKMKREKVRKNVYRCVSLQAEPHVKCDGGKVKRGKCRCPKNRTLIRGVCAKPAG